jgi:hypothetical protein
MCSEIDLSLHISGVSSWNDYNNWSDETHGQNICVENKLSDGQFPIVTYKVVAPTLQLPT